MNFDWADLAFASKKPLSELNAMFIGAPRELSEARLKQLVKQHLSSGHIILGLAKEPYVLGFEGQPQFATLQSTAVEKLINKINAAGLPHRIYTLSYFQRELPIILEKLKFRQALFINGSWKYSFHTRESFYTLVKQGTPYQLLSPFTDEAEARAYETQLWPQIEASLQTTDPKQTYSSAEMLSLASDIARASYDYSFQTGVALGQPAKDGYHLLARTFNTVVPYQTYAMLHGATRETHFSPPHNLNHYDTTHAEVELIIHAQKRALDLRGTTLFINLLPCPSCARMFTQTDIAEFVYTEDHSDGYAIKMLEAAGKSVRRLVL